MEQIAYQYKNLPIPGGGYVTGFLFHPEDENALYIRTDIGGTYRYDRKIGQWKSLIDHVTTEDLSETFPIGIALDPNDSKKLYIACGENRKKNGLLAISNDAGETFEYVTMPMHIHGNLNGRGTGYHLIVDRNRSECLWFASQRDGLWKSENAGYNWVKCQAMEEQYLTFVGQTPDGRGLIVSSAGVTTKRSETLRGKSLWVSYDEGASFAPIKDVQDEEIQGVQLAGHIAQRYAWDSQYLYVTYSVMGRDAYVKELGYSCDGGSVIGGKIFRYAWKPNGTITDGEDITPVQFGEHDALLNFGFSGIDVNENVPGLVIASTICKGAGDAIFRSLDYGNSWEIILQGLEIGRMDFRTSYMKPCYNGDANLIHWLTDLKINPHNEREAWFNTGTGVFRTDNLLDDVVVFSDRSDGIEETVHLNIYSPPAGEVQVIDILGDLGGFAFTDIDKPCDNSFADEAGNRYITCINADYSDIYPERLVVTPRGNWTGKTKGGLIYSDNQGRTFTRIDLPYGLSEELDARFRGIECPNTNSGWVAMSADGNTLVWSVADGIKLPVTSVIVSRDRGKNFQIVEVKNLDGTKKSTGGFKVFSDRVNADIFYGFGNHGDVYISLDGGCHFEEIQMPDGFPKIDYTLIDCANKTEVRAEAGKSGVFYIATGEWGLWKLSIKENGEEVALNRIGKEADSYYRVGLGIIRPDGDYLGENKAIYTAASIDGNYGFYRSLDDGKTFDRVNTDKQMFGEIISMDGDSRVFGRFYLATGSRGAIYGEIVN